MISSSETITIPVKADLGGFSSAMKDMENQAARFGTVFSGTIQTAIRNGKSFEDTLKSLALKISGMALSAGLKPLENMASNLFGSLFSGLGGGLIPNAKGNAFSSGGIVPFANGGIVSAPTLFNAGNKLGLMGEAGAEAIMPLARGADGRLGVRTGGGGEGRAVNVVFNVSTPDAAGFKRSEGQISAMLARSVSRGNRSL